MNQQCVIAEYDSVSKARIGLEVLAKGGLGEDQVSFVCRRDAPELREIAELQEGASDNAGSASGAGIGALLGGALATPVAASTLIGPFILFGPLVGAGVGAAVGGMLANVQNWGVDKTAEESYQARVESGSVLVIVTAKEHELRDIAATLKTTDPVEIRQYAQPETQERTVS